MSLQENDLELFNIMKNEKKRQNECLELIASENFTSDNVLECLGSILTNKYSEGLPNKRYYGGCQYIDELELLCQKRCLKAFDLNPEEWGVNVQPYSGSIANLVAMNALLDVGDKIMGLALSSGGHLSHGFNKNISGKIYNSLSYNVNENGFLDYTEIEKMAIEFKPKLIVAGASAYPRDWDYKKMKEICNKVGAFLMSDIAHTAGLIASKLLNNPFEFSDIITTTTHKSLRGPRAGLVFFKTEFTKQVNDSCFPQIIGGPHQNQIAAIATQMKQVNTEKFKEYSKQVIKNAKILSKTLQVYDFNIQTDGTDNHLLLIDLRNKKVNGSRVEYICDLLNITLNKNTIPSDKSGINPNGIRIGTPALTTRGFKETDFMQIASFINDAVLLTQKINTTPEKTKTLIEFKERISLFMNEINELKNKITEFSLFCYE